MTGENWTHIGAALKANVDGICEKKGITQADLCRRLHMTAQQWFMLFRSTRGPTLATLLAIAEAAGVDVSVLVKGIRHAA